MLVKILVAVLFLHLSFVVLLQSNYLYPVNNTASVSSVVTLPYQYSFSQSGILQEAGNITQSTSPYWYVNSGGYLYSNNGIGSTNHGKLPSKDAWRVLYAKNNPIDTDGGFYPQNIFRLLTRTKWENVAQSSYFRIDKVNLSSSSNRNASNGVLMFSRYTDGNNLYYFGLRVDGTAVIKKKMNGVYYTLSQKKVLPGTWDLVKNPNLLPTNKWFGIKSITTTNADTVSLKFYTDMEKTGVWKEILSVQDDGKRYGGAALTGAGYGGVRTDFMDVSFDDYALVGVN